MGKVMEYTGRGRGNAVASPSAPPSPTWARSWARRPRIFPADESAREFLRAQGRERDFAEMLPDADAAYDEIDRDRPKRAGADGRAPPHARQRANRRARPGPIKVDQVCIGSCTNSSYLDMMRVAAHSEGQNRAPGRKPGDRPRLPAGAGDARQKRRAERHDPGGRAHHRNGLRLLHRHGAKPAHQRGMPCAPTTAISSAAAAPKPRACTWCPAKPPPQAR